MDGVVLDEGESEEEVGPARLGSISMNPRVSGESNEFVFIPLKLASKSPLNNENAYITHQ